MMVAKEVRPRGVLDAAMRMSADPVENSAPGKIVHGQVSLCFS